ncbi:Phospho-N-acetylmuramoyl-pentapeptide-transferase [Candidatus Tiddalikarchaeum anstoanum]|nr:Phospho-N-acetylmuramoyl-pentapeptide-transferase [Candidatus Tiddalikarchaeum anstoanum]
MIVSLITLTVSFLVTYFITPLFINYFNSIGLVNSDVHKKTKTIVANSGGIPVISGIVMGLFTYIALKTFIYKDATSLIELFSAITSILIITFSGFLDDLNSKPQKYEGFTYKSGLKQWQKPLFTLPAVIPLMVINAGETTMSLPLLGLVNFGLLYPLVLIPLGIVGCANMVNLLGGFNGSEAGMGIIYTLSLGLYALYAHQNIAAIILLSTTVSLIAFLNFNFAPARILSGDSLTYALGGIVAVCAILGNMEKFALVTMSLFIIEWILKLRSLHDLKHFATSLGHLDKKTMLITSKYDKVYSLTHIAMGKNGSTEKVIAVKLVALQILVAVIPWILFVKIV